MNERGDFAAEVRTNSGAEVLVLQDDESVPLSDRAGGGVYVAEVGIDAIRIARGGNRSRGRQLVREDGVVNFATGAR